MEPQDKDSDMAAVDKDLLAILVCPETKARLVQIGDWLYSTDASSRRRYPIRDGIPIMLVDESEVVEPAEYDKVVADAGPRWFDQSGQ
jgi:hypothetical protein